MLIKLMISFTTSLIITHPFILLMKILRSLIVMLVTQLMVSLKLLKHAKILAVNMIIQPY
jgi:hypothetical protein